MENNAKWGHCNSLLMMTLIPVPVLQNVWRYEMRHWETIDLDKKWLIMVNIESQNE